MDKFSFQYSTKNIPVSSNSEYLKRLIQKVEDVTKRLRWRAFFFLNPQSKPDQKETYGIRSPKSPSFISQLKPFEDDLCKLIEDVRFRKVSSPLQNKLNEDLKRIRNESSILVPADKNKQLLLSRPSGIRQVDEKQSHNNIQEVRPPSRAQYKRRGKTDRRQPRAILENPGDCSKNSIRHPQRPQRELQEPPQVQTHQREQE